MFGLFKKSKKVQQPEYEVFLSEVAKYRSLIGRIRSADERYTVIYHFDDTRNEIEQLLDAANLSFSGGTSFDAKIVLMRSTDFLDNSTSSKGFGIVAEIYPLPTLDCYLLQYATDKEFNMRFMTAIDSPFFNLFGDGRLPALLERLGFDPNETIQHPMVAKSIKAAQNKLLKKVTNELEEWSSLEQWMTKNAVQR